MEKFFRYLLLKRRLINKKVHKDYNNKCLQIRLLSLSNDELGGAKELRDELDRVMDDVCETKKILLNLDKLRIKIQNEGNFNTFGVAEDNLDLSNIRVVEIVEKLVVTPKVNKELSSSDVRVQMLIEPYKFEHKTILAYLQLPNGKVIDCQYEQIGDYPQDLFDKLDKVIHPIAQLREKIVNDCPFFEVSDIDYQLNAYNFDAYSNGAISLLGGSGSMNGAMSREKINKYLDFIGNITGNYFLAELQNKAPQLARG